MVQKSTHVLQLIQLPQLGRQSAGQPVFRKIPVEDAEKDWAIEQTIRSDECVASLIIPDRQEGHWAARKERGGLGHTHRRVTRLTPSQVTWNHSHGYVASLGSQLVSAPSGSLRPLRRAVSASTSLFAAAGFNDDAATSATRTAAAIDRVLVAAMRAMVWCGRECDLRSKTIARPAVAVLPPLLALALG
jgi:hypothetical protein